MSLRFRHILTICITLLLVLARGHVEHASHLAFYSPQLSHHCADSNHAPAPASDDDEDCCALCEISCDDAPLLAPIAQAGSAPFREAVRLSAPLEPAGPPANFSSAAHRPRGPPARKLSA
ncbi:hypothetical protein OGR47_10365 [Methylocystis sp. MJC1]|jgi:hypothetical protein|uniref:hypothetical protein n=1 Tax=Methylocystis sp. MJC1 TaxID=2654282 RepID=UPI0013EBA918|nr:hypothetical protein [Methylocystis sp. MJC1]KAF2992248.1 hypothetical protein MJC1_00626 [Methylocystis sp. MJC1]MBU6527388.1 hypothetical protein [Methylocystis sp. MJC1]UZX10338.1 hypothetical protein OGR47_10365 [Methylocystis sp. MJC1]